MQGFDDRHQQRQERLHSFEFQSPSQSQLQPQQVSPTNLHARSAAGSGSTPPRGSMHHHLGATGSSSGASAGSPRISSSGLTSELLSALQDDQEDASMSNHEDGDDESMSSSSSFAMETELIIQQAFEDANSMSPPHSVSKPLPLPSELSISRQQFEFSALQPPPPPQQQQQQAAAAAAASASTLHSPLNLPEPMPTALLSSPPMHLNPSASSRCAFAPQALATHSSSSSSSAAAAAAAAAAASCTMTTTTTTTSPTSPASGLGIDGFPSAFELRRRSAQRMWLQVRFAPAMSKMIHWEDPARHSGHHQSCNLMDQEDQEEEDDDDDGDDDDRGGRGGGGGGGDARKKRNLNHPAANSGNTTSHGFAPHASPRANVNASSSSSCSSSYAPSCHADPQDFSVKWASAKDQVVDKEGYQLTIAHQEVNGFQLRLWSNDDFVLASDTANWFLAQGHLPRARVQLDLSFVSAHLQVTTFPIGYVCDENDQYVMEYLDTQACSSTASREQALYVRVYATEEVPSGQYEIPVRIFTQKPGFEEEELSWSSVVHIKVANLVLPLPKDWSFHLDLWQHLTSIARAHRVSLWSDDHFGLIDKYLALLSQLGQKAITIVATEMPWSGQQCHIEQDYPSALYEHALLEVYEDEQDARTMRSASTSTAATNASPSSPPSHASSRPSSPGRPNNGTSTDNGATAVGSGDGGTCSPRKSFGTTRGQAASTTTTTTTTTTPYFQIDFRHLDRLLTIANAHHITHEIEIFGLMSIWRDFRNGFDGPVRDPSSCDLWRIRCFNKQRHKFRYLTTMEEIKRFIRLLYEHFVARNLVDQVRICADEPHDLKLFYAQINFLRPLAPLFKYKVAINHYEFLSYAPPEVLDYVPYLPLACADVTLTESIKRQIHAKGGKMCWYVCCGPSFPNQFVSSPLVEGELIGLLTFFLKLDGFLRWNYCLWPAQPWHNLKWRANAWKVGDMYFVLPGRHGGPVETLRFESLRFALQVYELLKMASKVLPQAQAQPLLTEIASMVFRTSDYADFANPNLLRQDLFSMDPMDYQRVRTLLIETLASTPTAKATTCMPSQNL